MDAVQALLAAGLVPGVSLPPTSRYAEVGADVYTPPDGEPVPHLRRRLVPRPDRLAGKAQPTTVQYTCGQGDRLDNVAAALLGDPALWWRLADANGVIDPATMTSPPGRVLEVPGG